MNTILDEYKNEYIVMNSSGKLFAGINKKSCRHKHTTNFHEAYIDTYDELLNFCIVNTTYSIWHVDDFVEGYIERYFPIHVKSENIDRIFKSIDKNHRLIGFADSICNKY